MRRVVHEAALAVERVSPQSFWEFSAVSLNFVLVETVE